MFIKLDKHANHDLKTNLIIPPATKLGGGGVTWNHPVHLSVCLSVCLSVDVRTRLGKMISGA